MRIGTVRRKFLSTLAGSTVRPLQGRDLFLGAARVCVKAGASHIYGRSINTMMDIPMLRTAEEALSRLPLLPAGNVTNVQVHSEARLGVGMTSGPLTRQCVPVP